MNIAMIDWGAIDTILRKNTIVQVLLTVVVTLLIQILLREIIRLFVSHAVRGYRYASKDDEKKRARTLNSVLFTMCAVLLWIVAILIILTQFGVNLGALLTGAGLFGVIFGFGAQSVIRDFVAGLFVIGENQYRVGDVVTMQAGAVKVSGTVEDLTIRITRLRDMDGNLHIMSNGMAQAVTNLSYEYANVNIDVMVDYASDIDEVERIVNEVGTDMKQTSKLAVSIEEPIRFLRVDDFDPAGISIKALGRVEPAEQWAVSGEFRRRLKKAFEQNGIRMAGAPEIEVQMTPKQTKKKVEK